MISANWKTPSLTDIEQASVNIEKEITDALAQSMQLEIDNEILAMCFKESGWISVVVDPWVHNSATEINEWCAAHFNKGYFQHGNTWLIKEPKHVTMFILRWAS